MLCGISHSAQNPVMPIYGFSCTACGHSFDRLQKIADPVPEACPACAAAAVKRQITAPSFRLAGGGWYETDFGGNKRNLAEKTASASDKPTAAPAAAASSSASSG